MMVTWAGVWPGRWGEVSTTGCDSKAAQTDPPCGSDVCVGGSGLFLRGFCAKQPAEGTGHQPRWADYQRSGFGGRGGSSVWDALNVRSLRMRMGLRIPKSEVSMAGPGFVGWKLT